MSSFLFHFGSEQAQPRQVPTAGYMKNKFLAWIFTAVFMGCAHAPMDFTSQGADVCPLHGGVMDKATVPVIYGGEPDKSLTAYLEAQSKLFPHAQRPTYINMCLNKKSDKAIVWHCLK